jgi:hypothetical protein
MGEEPDTGASHDEGRSATARHLAGISSDKRNGLGDKLIRRPLFHAIG